MNFVTRRTHTHTHTHTHAEKMNGIIFFIFFFSIKPKYVDRKMRYDNSI